MSAQLVTAVQLAVSHSAALMQSLSILQVCPTPHAGHVPPPQSVPVSVPLMVSSEQLAAWQTLPLQTPSAQSLFPRQPAPAAHASQLGPPQS